MLFEMMSPQEILRLDNLACKVLQEVGVTVLSDEARKIFREIGADVNESTKVVKIPAALIQDAKNKTCGSFVLWNRDGENPIDLMDGKTRGHNVGGCIHIYDNEAHTVRDATKKDLENLTILIDALDSIDVVRPVVYPSEFPVQKRDIYTAATIMEYTRKPYGISSYSLENQKLVIAMASAVAGGFEKLVEKPFIWGSITPISPLKYSQSTTDILIGWAKAGLPLAICPCPIAGGSSPVTLAGTLMQSHAEFLAGFVLVQAIHPGIPVKYTTRPIPMDMRNGLSNFGAVELGMMSAAIVQLSKLYNVCSDVYGLATSSVRLDERAGYEKALNGLLPAIAGANLVASGGMLENALTASAEQLVIDNDIFALLGRVTRGITADDEALAYEQICEVFPEGDYLASEHTVAHMRNEMLTTHLSGVTSSLNGTNTTITETAQEAVKQILREHKAPVLEPERLKRMRDILEK